MRSMTFLKGSQLPAIAFVFLSGLLQGLTLVSFPALAPVLKQALPLTDSAYGALFLPQVLLAGVGAVAGGTLAARLGLPLLMKLALSANGLSQCALLLGVHFGGNGGLVLLFAGTALLGLGFGLSAAPLNRYPILFFPYKPESALTALHTMIGAGLALGPWLVGRLADAGNWWLFPVALAVLAASLWLCSAYLSLSTDDADTRQSEGIGDLLRQPAFRLLLAVAMVYALCEGLFSNWAVIFLREDKQLSAEQAGLALSGFWAALALGRLLTAFLVTRLPSNFVWLSFPILMAFALWCLPAVTTATSAFAAYAFAGLSCSGFFPLTVFRASSHYPRQVALVSACMVAALMTGVGLGSFTFGWLRAAFSLPTIFHMAVALAILTGMMGVLSLRLTRGRDQATPVAEDISTDSPIIKAGFIICPACGGENPEDAVFCVNHDCHKALGDFKYVLEELMATKNWLERLADRVAAFVSRPQFIILHLLWFAAWILANESEMSPLGHFDAFPYDLLSIVLAIEAVLITGFLLISQNHQYN
ncbi:MAG: MFS transporter, partial [Gammaproteobacteria bacterium]